MKFRRKITLLILGTLGLMLLVLSWISISAYRMSRMSIGIIGGADGPTSILISNGNLGVVFCAAAFIVITLTIILLIIFRRKK